jgi:hypothetical protein
VIINATRKKKYILEKKPEKNLSEMSSLEKISLIIFLLCACNLFVTNQSVRHGFPPTVLHVNYADSEDGVNGLKPKIINANSDSLSRFRRETQQQQTTTTNENNNKNDNNFNKLSNLSDRNGINTNITVKVSGAFTIILCFFLFRPPAMGPFIKNIAVES